MFWVFLDARKRNVGTPIMSTKTFGAISAKKVCGKNSDVIIAPSKSFAAITVYGLSIAM